MDLFIDAEYRGCGHGSDAVDAATRSASEGGAEYVLVSCEWHNEDARRFYEANGFAEK